MLRPLHKERSGLNGLRSGSQRPDTSKDKSDVQSDKAPVDLFHPGRDCRDSVLSPNKTHARLHVVGVYDDRPRPPIFPFRHVRERWQAAGESAYEHHSV